jgi:hypothetical protein
MESITEVLPIIVSIALFCGCYLFYRAYRKSKLLLPEEVDAVSIYTEQAGGRFNSFNWTIPFVRISCYKNFIAITCRNYKFILKAGDVQSIKKSGFLSDGLLIVHNRLDLPEKLIIWPRNMAKLITAIQTSLRIPNE